MTDEPRVDILVATYNSNIEYLKLQLDSILNQTYKNIRVLISDDCSNDKKVIDVLSHYEIQDKRIRVFTQEKNLGYIKNFEFLLSKATSDYIMYSDHDDIWYEDKVEKSLNKLILSDTDLVFCNCKQIDEDGKVLHNSYMDFKAMPKFSNKNGKDGLVHKDILSFSRHISIGCSQIFTKKVRDLCLPFTDKVMAHDWITVFIASNLKGVEYIDEPLFEYRLHGSNVFGGRDLTQNLKLWKQKNGDSFKSFMNYRDRAITKSYLDGVLMCNDYIAKLEENNLKQDPKDAFERMKLYDEVEEYYREIKETRLINTKTRKYKKYLDYKGIGKRKLKEKVLFHYPILAYLKFKMG